MTTWGRILAIQSQVAHGHVGNSAAVLPLQRLGFDVLAVPTVILSHHPGYGAWRGFKVGVPDLEAILQGLSEQGLLTSVSALLSGYLGDPAVADVVVRAADHLGADGRPLFLCDPVIGDDDTGVFVADGIPEAFRGQLLPRADIATPNRFELAHLTGRPVGDVGEAIDAAHLLRSWGPKLVVATGLAGMPGPGTIGTLAVSDEGAFLARSPHRAQVPHGTGDALSALFLGHYLRRRELVPALATATSAIDRLIARTLEAGSAELAIVAAQNDFASTPDPGAIEKVG